MGGRRRGPVGPRRTKPAGERVARGGFPTLGDGTPYRAGMTVQAVDPVSRWRWQGRLQWTQRDPDTGDWRAVVSWETCLGIGWNADMHGRPRAQVLLADLIAVPEPEHTPG